MDWTTHPLRKDYPLSGFDLPEPHWGGQVPYDVDPGVGSQTLRTPFSRELNESRCHVSHRSRSREHRNQQTKRDTHRIEVAPGGGPAVVGASLGDSIR